LSSQSTILRASADPETSGPIWASSQDGISRDYVGSISKCGDRRVRTLLYEAANVMLTRYKGQLKLKDWALAIARRSTMRKARIALARRLAIIMHAMLRDGTEFEPA
jgi:transposase